MERTLPKGTVLTLEELKNAVTVVTLAPKNFNNIEFFRGM